jgi:hypothetical protein
MKKEVFGKVGGKCHCSSKRAEEYLGLLKLIGKELNWLEKEDLKMIKSI